MFAAGWSACRSIRTEPVGIRLSGQASGGAAGRSGVAAAGASAARGDHRYAPGPGGVLRRRPAADAAAAAKDVIQSVRINANPFSAEFAEPGEPVEILTKPASEHYHGNGRIDFNDARLNRPGIPSNRSGRVTRAAPSRGYIGGPIVPNRWGLLAYGGRWEQDDNVVVNATPLDPVTLQPQSLRLNVATPARYSRRSFKTDVQVTQNHTAAVDTTERAGSPNGRPARRFRPARTGVHRGIEERTATFWVTSAFPKVLNELRGRVSRKQLLDRAVTTTPAVLVLQAFNEGGNQDALFQGKHDGRTRVERNHIFPVSTHSIRRRSAGRCHPAWRRSIAPTSTAPSSSAVDVVRDGLGNPKSRASAASRA